MLQHTLRVKAFTALAQVQEEVGALNKCSHT